MSAKIKRKNVRRLASLTALGAGTLAVGGSADASIVYTALNSRIGYGSGFTTTPITFSLPSGVGSNILSIFAHSSSRTSKTRYGLRGFTQKFEDITIHSKNGPNVSGSGLRFALSNRVLGNGLAGFAAGAIWNFGNRSSGSAGRIVSAASGRGPGGSNFLKTNIVGSDDYFLMEFDDIEIVKGTPTDHILFGWGQLAVGGTRVAPDLTLIALAYDNTGVKIAAGAGTPGPTVPEPATGLLALSALVLGAAGVRKWRGSKPAEQEPASD